MGKRIWMLGALAATATAVILLIARTDDNQVRQVSVQDARALLAEAVNLAQAGDYVRLCQVIAANEGNCQRQIDSATRVGIAPEAPTIVREQVYEGSGEITPMIVLTVEGSLADGKPFRGDFGVIQIGEGQLRSITAPFWTGVKVELPATCRTDARQVGCAQTEID